MCFSANASFTASAILAVIGVISIKKVKHPSQLLFASIPLIFGLQQLSEGFLWITIADPEYEKIRRLCTYFFIFIAQVLWPIWVPISVLLFEKKASRNNVQRTLVVVGSVVGLYLAYCLVVFEVTAEITEHHISYTQEYPSTFIVYGVVLYLLATILPVFLSHIKRMWVLGLIVLISYLVTAIFYHNYVLSVWCFFASIISLYIFTIILNGRKGYNN